MGQGGGGVGPTWVYNSTQQSSAAHSTACDTPGEPAGACRSSGMEVDGNTARHGCFARRVESTFGSLMAQLGHVDGVPRIGAWTVNAAPPAARPGKDAPAPESDEEEWEDTLGEEDAGSDAEVAALRRAMGSCRQLDVEDEYDEQDAMATGNTQRDEGGLRRMVVDDSHVECGIWENTRAGSEDLVDVSEDETTCLGKKVRFSDKVEVREYTPLTWEDELGLWGGENSGDVVPDHVSNPQKYAHYFVDWSEDAEDEAQEQAEAFLSLRRTVLKIKSLGDEAGAACVTVKDGPVFNTKVLPTKRPVGDEPAEAPKRSKASSTSVRLCIEDEI